MNKRTIYIILLLTFHLFSCDNFVLKKEHKEEIVKERLDKLNWDEVDQPPLFDICKRKSEEELESCFQSTITTHIYNHLSKQSITIKKPIQDTVWIPLLITKESNIIIEDFDISDRVISEIPNLKQIIEEAINSLPKVKPAHTRSTPVSAKYRLPLVIRVD